MPNNIEIRSEEVQEIIGFIPHWLIRSGITVIFTVVIVLFTGSFFFKYPDVIVAKATITGNTPPANLKARISGKITQILVTDKQKVQENEVLAIIENTCDYSQYIDFRQKMKAFKITDGVTEGFALSEAFGSENLQLGELQTYYSSFLKQINDYKNFLEIDYHQKKIVSTEKQISEYQKYIQNLEKQLLISAKDLKLHEKQFQRDSILDKREVISAEEYEKSTSSFLQKKLSHESAKNSISNTKIQISSLEQGILDLELQFRQQNEQTLLSLQESSEQFNSQAKLWEQNYLLKSPFAGKVVFSKIWSNYQNIAAGDVIFTILPAEAKKEILARANLPLLGAGKVKKGQNVNLKLSAYPYQQYGMLKGKISEISEVNDGENYTVKIILPNSMQTNYNIKIPFKQNMQASAEILTEELPLIARFFNPIKSLFLEN